MTVSETAPKRMKVSREGIVLIKSFEGFRPRAVRRDDGRWTIGYGHTLSAREGATVGEQDAELLLQYDLLPVVAAIHDHVLAPLNQHQFDALASFAFSVGAERFAASDVVARLNAGAASEAADAIAAAPAPTPEDAGLRRRAAERALFMADPSGPVALADLLSAPLPLRAVQEDPAPAAPEQPADAPEPVAPTVPPHSLQRFAPYGAVVVGPLPGLTPIVSAPVLPTVSAPAEPAPPAPVDEPEEAAETTPSAPAPSAPELVLTPFQGDEAAPHRPVWPEEQRAAGTDEAPLFGEQMELNQTLGGVIRHEQAQGPTARIDRGQLAAFGSMGTIGLVSFAAAMAAFRRAGGQEIGGHETLMVGWGLAVISIVLVTISGYSLYRIWTRPPAA
jgi:lysozyme